MTDLPVPPIPLSLAHLPVVAGLAVPWITPRTPDGRYLFGVIEAGRQRSCLIDRRCQVCGRALTRPMVLLVRESDLARRCIAEPPACPPCSAYTIRACPMVSGRLAHYRATARDLGGMADAAPDVPARLGAPAEAWYAVWLARYDVITDPATGRPAASFAHIRPLRVRRIGTPPDSIRAVEGNAPPSAGERGEVSPSSRPR